MLRRHAAEFRTLLMAVDATLAIVVLVVSSVLRFGSEWSSHWVAVLDDPIPLMVGYAVGWVAALWLTGLYRPRARWTIRSEAADLLRAIALMAVATLAVLFWLRLPDVSRAFLLVVFPVQFALGFATRVTLRLWFRRLRADGHNRRFILVVGAGQRAQSFAERLRGHRELGLDIIGFVDDEPALLAGSRDRHLGRLEDLERLLDTEVIDEVAICLPFSQWDKVDAIAHLCEEQGKIVRIPMDVLDRAFSTGRVEELDGIPVFSLINGPDRVLGLAAKRGLDLLVSGLALIAGSPLIVGVALLILARDGRPILFRQTRVGLHGRRFRVLKFRTMTRDAEAQYDGLVSQADHRAFKLSTDPRVTPTGRFLRRTSLDELPQLINVLRGEMSLVGPRPAPPREVQGYDLWHRRRLSMKPGITGLWQVTARRNDDFDNRAELDLSYIDRWSLWLDFKILLRTIPAAFEGR
jgi:exopolysaccharide biosynthesis polyprenyl glycosylphosphotransferase